MHGTKLLIAKGWLQIQEQVCLEKYENFSGTAFAHEEEATSSSAELKKLIRENGHIQVVNCEEAWFF